MTAADLLNEGVLPFFEAAGVAVLRMLTDRGTEFCGVPDRHPYELYLAVENIDHPKTKVRHPQANGIVERLQRTILDEFYRVAFRKTIYATLEALQADLDAFFGHVQHRSAAPRAVVLRQDADANVCGQCAARPGETAGGLTGHPDQHCLSGRVLAFTDHDGSVGASGDPNRAAFFWTSTMASARSPRFTAAVNCRSSWAIRVVSGAVPDRGGPDAGPGR